MSEKKFYITTAIDYVNAPPHLGHALEKIQADVLARFHRARGRDVFFLTGTDEHGAKVFRVAKAAGKEPKVLAEEISEKFKSLKKAFNLSWDDFIITTDKERHWPGVRLMWEKLVESGDIYKAKYRGLYCVGHEAFITKKELVDGKCPDHQREPELVEDENYFFRLSKYTKEIESRIKNKELKIVPETRANEILSLVENEGLEDVSFSRSREAMPWGVPVPGDESQTIYVWCDALTNYLSAVGYGRNENYKLFWPADVQVIGKDILRFHAAIWPGMLLSAGLELPKILFVHGFITVDGGKMSKTVGNVINPLSLVEKYGTDAVRYYLLREIPAYGDGDFSISRLETVYNADLANGLGNFAARVLALVERDANLQIHANDANTLLDSEIQTEIEKTKEVVYKKIEEFKLHEALAELWSLMAFGDAYVNREAPWKLSGAAKEKALFNLVVLLDNIAAMLLPFLPETSEKITKSIEWNGNKLFIKKLENLFPRLTPKILK
ncbi:MAG: methionine--tRNA ligase [Candidatus Liptonbacteria bacterium]|nr:methionine--tRNA ligase [Candidatus Liptonbacteria bacterium]